MRILVAVSGGVDSSVAAFLLKQQGYDITGCTLLLANDDCMGADLICKHLGIEHVVVDVRKQFNETVIDYFLSEYQKGRTPNPCVLCNKEMKLKALLDYAKQHGFDRVATGHYAAIKMCDGKSYIARTDAGKKDQTYFLYRLSSQQIEHLCFPLQTYTKDEIRAIARENNLPSASKSDSQDVCFIRGDYRDFLHAHGIFGSPGEMMLNNRVIAQHYGLVNYTIGQRKIGVSWEHPLYVNKIDVQNNILHVSDNDALFATQCTLSDVVLTHPMPQEFTCFIKPRSAAVATLGVVRIFESSSAEVKFNQPFRALTPGQAAVFYTEDGLVLGGGVIC